MISAGLELDNSWYPVELFVDSGATYTILRDRVAKDVGFDYESGRKITVQVGDGVHIPVYMHTIPLQIGGVKIAAPVGFSPGLGVPFNLMGRAGIFDKFRICFREKRRMISFLCET